MSFLRCFISVILFTPFILFAQQSIESFSDSFFANKAIKVDSSEAISVVNQFLNYQVEKGVVVWFKGTLTTNEGVKIENLELNFNVFNNHLYALLESEVYKVANFAISAFSIKQNGKIFEFRKGFAIPFSVELDAKFDDSSQDIMSYLTSYKGFKDLHIKELQINEDQNTELRIVLSTGSRDQIYRLKRFLDANKHVKSAEATYGLSELNVNNYFQILFKHEKFTVLKYHFKRSATAESVSLVKHEASFMFDDEDYYIADSNNHLLEFLFTRKSIDKILSSMGVSYSKRLKGVGNEEKVIKWFNSNTFY